MLRNRSISAVFWSTFELLASHGSRFLFTIFLARLLSPEEFGVIAIISLFIGIAGAIVESGFTPVLIQRQDVSEIDKSTVFWINTFLGFVFAAVIFSLSHRISIYFDLHTLDLLAKAMAFNVVMGSLSSVHRALLIKDLNFRPLTAISVTSILLSGAGAVYLAVGGFGVWALACQTLIASSLTMILLWLASAWRPKFVFSVASARRLSSFGGYLLASAVLEVLYTRLYSLLIGKLYGPRELGFYTRAESTTILPITITSGVLARVAFPLFSASSGDKENLRRDMKLAVQMAMLINTPAMLGLAVVAESYVVTLFGENWRPSVPIVQILCIGGLLVPLHVLNVQVLMATGNGSLLLRLEIVKKIVGISVIVVSSRFGVYGMAWGTVLASALALFANVWFAGHVIKYRLREQINDSLPALLFGSVMSLAVLILSGELINFPMAGRLLAELALGISVYAGAVLIFHPTAYSEIKARIRLRTNV